MNRRRLLALFPILIAGCTIEDKRDDDEKKKNEPPTAPEPVPPKPTLNTVEFRVTGGDGTATISYTSSIYGTVDTISRLPWTAFFQTYDDVFFVSMSVFNDIGGTLIAQIFVNGRLLTETRGDGFVGIVISGNVKVNDEEGTILMT